MVTQYLVKIGDLYLSTDGVSTVAADRYLVDVDISELLSDYEETEYQDLYHNLIVLVDETVKKAKKVSIKMLGIEFQMGADLRDLRNQQKADGEPIQLILTHPYNSEFNYDLQVNFKTLKWGNFLTNSFRNVEMEFTTFDET